jgi:O6-methylguanine-DNA--protein-cysteine methyltransferase
VHPRKVAQVMRYNKFPDIYPCYKVIASDWRISWYSWEGGVDGKIERLKKDWVEVVDGIVGEEYVV